MSMTLSPKVANRRQSAVRPKPATLQDMSSHVEKAVARVNMFNAKGGQQIALGSCFVVNAAAVNSKFNGLLVGTCFHCVDQVQFLQGVLPGGGKFEMEALAVNPVADCAIARVVSGDLSEASQLAFPLAESGAVIDLPKLSFVAAHGHPLGLQKEDEPCTTSCGHITNRVPFEGPFGGVCENVIFTDAAINPGNSGGPLTDREGRVHGICSWGIGGADNLGFAPSIRWLIEVIQSSEPADFAFRGFPGAVIVQSPYGPMVLATRKDSDLAAFQPSTKPSLRSRFGLGAKGLLDKFRTFDAEQHPKLARRRRKALRDFHRVRRVPNPEGLSIVREINGRSIQSVAELRETLSDTSRSARITLECGLLALRNDGKERSLTVRLDNSQDERFKR